jgi:hypothetical protein
MALLGLAMGALVIGHIRNVQGDSTAGGRSVLAMAQAREALIGYAATYRDLHPNEVFGYLPCPDRGTGVEGQAQSACGGADVTVIGRLPWKTLDLPPLRDASGECLWYAVSGNFKYNPKTADLMNRDSNGLIEVMATDGTGFIAGASPRQRAVAVVFSPGAILSGQDRSLATTNPPTICGGGKHYPSGPDSDKYDPANYLDTDVASSIDNAAASTTANALSRFIAAEHADRTPAVNDAFNDLLMPIFPDDIFARHLDKRADMESALTDPLTGMLRKAADCLLAYGRSNDRGLDGKYLPWAAQMTLPGFGNSLNYIDIDDDLGGRLPYTAQNTAVAEGTHENFNYDEASEPLLREYMECTGWSGVDEFWDDWKDHLFYAVADGHNVRHHDGHEDDPCDDNECIEVENPAPDAKTTDVAAVVIFAGARQAGQTRNNDANPSYNSVEKADPANYLEGDNLTSIQLNPSGADPNRLFSKIDGNDAIICIVTRPVGSDTELFIDPTCGTSARCGTDGDLLAAYQSGLTNTCRVGTSGIDPDCLAYADRIRRNNCPGNDSVVDANGNPYSCKRAARDFLRYDCLLGFASAECQLAHSTLTTCE